MPVGEGSLGEERGVRISVIIPVYNVERYLVRCLDSVFAAAQRLTAARADTSVEMICVNDGSTDGSPALLADWAVRHPADDGFSFVRIDKANGGLGSARNAALDVMTGDYVTFVDSDDWLLADALATFTAVAEASGASLVVSSSFLRDAAFPTPVASFRPPRWRLLPSPRLAGRKVQYGAWNKLYRADLFKSRRYPATVYEDFPVTTDILCAVGTFALVNEPLYVYCTNAGAQSLVRSPFTERKMRDSVSVVRSVLETSRRQTDAALRRFALHQAANGHSSTIGQVWKSGDVGLMGTFCRAHQDLCAAFPELAKRLTLKARYRLWRCRTRVRKVHET